MSKFDDVTLQKDLAFLRRNQPRNEVTMRVCDALDEMLRQRPLIAKGITADEIPQLKPDKFEVLPECPTCAERKKRTRERVKRHREARS
jgi:hypothetical protein